MCSTRSPWTCRMQSKRQTRISRPRTWRSSSHYTRPSMDPLGASSLHLSPPSLKRASTIAIPSTRVEIIRGARTIAIQAKVLVKWMSDQLTTLTGTITANLLRVFRTLCVMWPCWCRTLSWMLIRRAGWTSKSVARVISRYLTSTTRARSPP